LKDAERQPARAGWSMGRGASRASKGRTRGVATVAYLAGSGGDLIRGCAGDDIQTVP
jgi:hypothetical protein